MVASARRMAEERDKVCLKIDLLCLAYDRARTPEKRAEVDREIEVLAVRLKRIEERYWKRLLGDEWKGGDRV